MMKPQIPPGTRDFLPEQVYKRDFIFSTIKSVFQKYGYLPIETPVMELLSTLMGKYGEEGDKLLFKLLNNGDFLAKANEKALKEKNSKKLLPSIAKRGLRYDLTVPFARFVVMHQNDLSFPFKRYQIQPVWRADRPQKGRYREFFQCDVDVVGSDSLLYEAELIQIYGEVFDKLGFNSNYWNSEINKPHKIQILLNNRKVLLGMCQYCGCENNFMDVVQAIDKLDKLPRAQVQQELIERGLVDYQIQELFHCLDIVYQDCTDEDCERCGDESVENVALEFKYLHYEVCKLNCLKNKFLQKEISVGIEGCDEIRKVFEYLNITESNINVEFTLNLARGLSYYTGCIMEVKPPLNVKMGSIGGGGRYDDLTGSFGMKDMSGVGVSFGAERIYDVMEELDLFPKDVTQSTKIILLSFDENCLAHAAGIASTLRDANIATEVFPSAAKMKKQMKYANDRGIPYVIVIGSNEIESGQYNLKNMITGEQSSLTIDDVISKIA